MPTDGRRNKKKKERKEKGKKPRAKTNCQPNKAGTTAIAATISEELDSCGSFR